MKEGYASGDELGIHQRVRRRRLPTPSQHIAHVHEGDDDSDMHVVYDDSHAHTQQQQQQQQRCGRRAATLRKNLLSDLRPSAVTKNFCPLLLPVWDVEISLSPCAWIEA
eukprot:2749809-Rhodomonas_salina.1